MKKKEKKMKKKKKKKKKKEKKKRKKEKEKEKKKVMMKYKKRTDFIFGNCMIIEQLLHSLPFKPWDYLGQFLWR